MAKIKWAKGIDYVSGLLSARPKKGEPHSSHANALLATHRKAATTNPDCTRVYMVGEYNRSTDPSAKELLIRARFNAVSKAVALRRKDLMQINQDNAAFLAQRDTAGGCKTLTKYLWKVCGDDYDAEHGA